MKTWKNSAYRSKEIETFLKEKNCESFIHEKGYRGKPLTKIQKESNNKKSKTRARVEHIFGFMTNSMHDALHMKSIGVKFHHVVPFQKQYLEKRLVKS